MKTIINATLLITGLFIFSVSAAEMKTLRLGTEGAYAPFNSVNKEGELVGFDIEIGKALCAEMKVKCEWVTSDWDGLIPALLAKKFDAIVASMSITEERKQKIAFTSKYYTTPGRFVRMKGDTVEANKESLKGKVIGVQGGTISENFVRGEFGEVVDIKVYGTQDEANLDFMVGRVDVVFADSVVLVDFLKSKSGQQAELFGPSFTEAKYFGEGIGIGLRKNDQALLETFNQAIDAIRANGTYQKINAKYFDFDLFGE